MKARTLILFIQDLKFQIRSGIHPLYLIISFLYILILRLLPPGWRPVLFPAIVLTDPALLGFLFVGALLFFERDQGLFPLLSVSPIGLREYMLSKMFNLSLVSAGTALLIGLAVQGFSINYLLLLLGTGVTASLFTLAGIALALRFRNVSSFLVFSGSIDILIILPLLSSFKLWDSPFLFLLPTRGTLVFLEGAMGKTQPPGHWIAGTAGLLLWLTAAWKLAEKTLKREFTLLPGDQNE